jgi:hypothetical protein
MFHLCRGMTFIFFTQRKIMVGFIFIHDKNSPVLESTLNIISFGTCGGGGSGGVLLVKPHIFQTRYDVQINSLCP